MLRPVQSAQSASSLQLTLENKNLAVAIQSYIKELSTVVGDSKDVIGYAAAINGKVHCADIYASHSLFQKLWPKLIKASAVEAVAELKKGNKFDVVAAAAVKAFLDDAEKGKAKEKEVDQRMQEIQRETSKTLLFESRANPAAKMAGTGPQELHCQVGDRNEARDSANVYRRRWLFSPRPRFGGEGSGVRGCFVASHTSPSPPTPLPRSGGEGRKANGGGIWFPGPGASLAGLVGYNAGGGGPRSKQLRPWLYHQIMPPDTPYRRS